MLEGFQKDQSDLDQLRQPANETLTQEKVRLPKGEAERQAGAVTVAISEPQDMEATYLNNKNEINQTGTSTDIEELKGQATLNELEANTAEIQSLDLNTDEGLDRAESIIQSQTSLLQFGGPKLNTFVTSKYARLPSPDMETQNVQKTLTERIVDDLQVSDTLMQIKDEVLAGGSTETPENIVDFIGSMAPDFAADGIGIIKEVVGDQIDAGLFSQLDFGGLLKQYKRILRAAPPEEKIRILRETAKAIEERIDFLGINDENDLKRFFAVMTFMENPNPTDAEIDFEGNLERVFQLLEWIPAIGSLTRVARISARVKRGSTLRAMTKGNKGVSQETIDRALESSNPETTKALGTTPEEVVNTHVLPDTDTPNVQSPNGPDASMLHNKEGLDILREDATLYKDVDYTRSASFVEKAVAKLEKTIPTVMVSASAIKKSIVDPLVWSKTLTIGKDSKYGFSSLEEAQSVVNVMADQLEGAKVSFFAGDPNSGKLIRMVRNEKEVPTLTIQKGKFETPSAIAKGFEALRAARAIKNPTKAQRLAEANAKRKLLALVKKKWPSYSADKLDQSIEEIMASPPAKPPPAFVDQQARTFQNVVFSPDPKAPNEVFIRIEVDGIVTPKDVGTWEPITRNLLGLKGGLAKWMDKASTFSREILDVGTHIDIQEAKLKGLLEKSIEPYSNLSVRGRRLVDSVLEKAEAMSNEVPARLDRRFSLDELNEIFDGNKQLIEAHEGVRDAFDLMYVLNNQKLYRELKGEGWLHFKEGDYQGLAKSADAEKLPDLKAKKDTYKVYNASTGTFENLTKEALIARTKRGENLLESKFAEREKAVPDPTNPDKFVYENTKLILSSKGELDTLPLQVLKYRPNYIPRIHVGGAIIRESRPSKSYGVKGLDDAPIGRAIKSARTPKEAEEWVLANRDPDVPMVVDTPRERSGEAFLSGQTVDYHQSSGNLFYSKRGTGITSIHGEYNMANIEDSIRIGVHRTQDKLSLDQAIKTQKEAWVKTYGKLLVGQGKKPLTDFPDPLQLKAMRADFKKSFEAGVSEGRDITALVDEAIAHADRIIAWEGLEAGLFIDKLNSFLTRLAVDWIDPRSGEFLAETRRNLSERILTNRFNPVSTAKSVNFFTMITANPIRQLLLQTQQVTLYMGVEGGAKYFGSGRYFRDGNILNVYSMARATGADHVIDSLKKMSTKLGYAEGEIEKMMDAWDKSGFIERIGTNQLIPRMTATLRKGDGTPEDGLSNWFESMVDLGKRGGVKGSNLLRKFGFDLGESLNLRSAWLVALERYKVRNPGLDPFSPEAQRIIRNDANQLSLNMGRTGRLAYQDGFISLAFQFYSIQQKITQTMLRAVDDVSIPGLQFAGKVTSKVSNKTFTPSEARRIAMIQAGLYGTAGFGIVEGFQSLRDNMGVELSPFTNNALEGGLVEVAFNKLFNTSLAVSSSFAPAQGLGQVGNLWIPTMLDTFYNMDAESISKMFFGPTYTTGKKIGDAIDLIKDVALGTNLPVGEKFAIAAQEMGTILSGYGKYVNARAAMKSGYIMSNTGNPMVRASANDLLGKALLGLQTKDEEDAFRIYRETQGLQAGDKAATGSKKELDLAARDYYNNVKKALSKFTDTGEPDLEARRIIKLNSMLFRMIWSPNELNYIRGKLQEIEAKEPFQDKLSNLIIDSFSFTSSGEKLRSQIVNNPGAFGINSEEELERVKSLLDPIVDDIDSVTFEDVFEVEQ